MDRSSYFSVDYQTNINVKALPEGTNLPTESDFAKEIPQPFLISSEVNHIEAASLRSLRKIGDANDELADYLANQSRKIDVILSYVLQLQDDPADRYVTERISASGLAFQSTQRYDPGQHVQLKIFLPEEAVAVYAYGQVNAVAEQDSRYTIDVNYCLLREEDQEHLIRATLHIQTKQLQQRRNQQ
ncbi:PilZ domain-containing protein [Neiella sp. HB171785]|uniref:PilZ domain-containing protein n=1 Tax=Neiella litorisoli TaxID=2771431 RepID=A0A8J6UG70_9GAMM|nr:PilZ domain-containing protein [Neiella litorisoli]MBD1389656.1 PilZ domain-containing protein [Neiella litorisoli]